MEKKKIALAAVAATAIALSSGQSAFAEGTNTTAVSQGSNLKLMSTETPAIDSVQSITEEGIVVKYNKIVDSQTVIQGSNLKIEQPASPGVALEFKDPIISDDNQTVTYAFTNAPNVTPGTWKVNDKTFEIATYKGLKVLEINHLGVTVQLKEVVTSQSVLPIKIFAPNSNTSVAINATKVDATGKKVTYEFKSPLNNFVTGDWTVDTVKYNAKMPKVAEYDGLQVISITSAGISLKLPSGVGIGIAKSISVKNPKGEEVAVTAPTSTDANKNVIYTFASPLESIAAGKWTINTDVQFTVLSDEENQKKADAVDKKIKTARTTLSTNKNYVKNILAAKTAYDELTPEQKVKVKEDNADALNSLFNEITKGVYKEVSEFEGKLTTVANAADDATFVTAVNAATEAYNKLTKTQLSYLDAKVKKQYTAYLNEAIVKEAFSAPTTVAGNADKIIAFNKAYKKLDKKTKEEYLLASDKVDGKTKKDIITVLTDKTLQKNASLAAAVQKKFANLEVQKKNDKNKKLYYTEENQQDGTTKKVETTTKTSEPVMVYSLSAVTKAQTALDALKIKNEAAGALVNPTLLNKAIGDENSPISKSLDKGDKFKTAVEKIATTPQDFVTDFNAAKTAYIALTPDEQKYAIDKNALKQYKAYLKIDKVAVMYDKMDDPEASTKSMKLAYTAKGDITSITNDVKFSKGKFTIPKGNYTFSFTDNGTGAVQTAWYKDGTWTIGSKPDGLTPTPVTAQEIYAYAKAFNALKDAQEKLLLTSNTTTNTTTVKYDAYVGKENDYKKAAAVEKKIVSAAKSKRKATIASAQKAYDALTADQQKLVTNETELTKLK